MKKFLFIFSIGILVNFNLLSQNSTKSGDYGWRLVASGTEQELNKVHFADSQTGYISGNEGLVMKSSTGGETWSRKVIPTLSHFFCVYATGPEDVYIGAWDTVYTTHDGGGNWTGIQSPMPNFIITDIQFVDDMNGIGMLAASTCIRTNDGGETWTYKGAVGAIEDFYGCHFLNENYGFGVGDCGMIAKTTDGGENWDLYRWDDYTNWSCIHINDVYLTSQNTGFAIADSGYLFKTTDGGLNWSKTILAEENVKLKSIFFVDSNTGYIAGSFGRIYKTTDGGENWYMENVPTENDLNSIFFVNDSLGFAVGSMGTILVCHNMSSSGKQDALINPDAQVTVYPNPARQSVAIETNLQESSVVQVDLYQIDGKWVEKLANGRVNAGKQTMQISLERIPKGAYLCRISSRNWVKQIKMVIY